MMSKNKFLVVFLLLSLQVSLRGQSNFVLKIIVTDYDKNFILKNKINPQSNFKDSILLQKEVTSVLQKFQNKGFLAASLDSVERKDSIFTAYFQVRKSFYWATVRSDIDPIFLSKIGYRGNLWSGQKFDYQEFVKFQESLLTFTENNGFPFASARLDSILITSNHEISARLFFKKYKFITISDIEQDSETVVSKVFLENYLGLRTGAAYDKSRLKKVRDRLKELPFVEEKKDAVVTFKEDKAVVHLFITKKNASRFDFLLGLLPNPNAASTGGNRYILTGTANADMYNLLNRGERLYFDFQQLRPQTQQLKVQISYPYLLGTPLGVDTKFDLYKRDTTNIDVSFDLGLQYLQEGAGNYLKAFLNITSSSLLSVNKGQIRESKALPTALDVQNTALGAEISRQRLDYRFNPRNGWNYLFRAGAGVRKVTKNSSILNLVDDSQPNFNFSSLYDSVQLKTFQYKIQGQAEYYFPLFRRSALKTALRFGGVFSEKPLYRNEQFRIGGNRLLRGFDEEQFFSSLYGVFTLEYRFLLGKNSNFYLFSDYAYLEDVTVNRRRFDHPLGLGAGINFETSVGIFALSYALGRTDATNFDIRAGKIHFGYVSLF